MASRNRRSAPVRQREEIGLDEDANRAGQVAGGRLRRPNPAHEGIHRNALVSRDLFEPAPEMLFKPHTRSASANRHIPGLRLERVRHLSFPAGRWPSSPRERTQVFSSREPRRSSNFGFSSINLGDELQPPLEAADHIGDQCRTERSSRSQRILSIVNVPDGLVTFAA